MSGPSLSVVIPTRNRRDTLMATLRALAAQKDLNEALEVVIADDGSTDGSAELIRGTVIEAFNLRVLTLDHAGPAHARNRGIAEASADRVVLLGDDTVPTTDALATHLAAARGREIAVQGRIDWDPDRPITDEMAFLAPAGPQFWFRDLVDGEPVPWAQVLGSNLSAPKHWFLEEPFNERFTDACMEDTELAWRWAQRGWETVWSETALCHHRHHYGSIEPFLVRQRRAGRWARFAVRLHPELRRKVVIEPVAAIPRQAYRAGVGRLRGRARPEDSWDLRCRLAFLRGFLFGR